MHHWMMLIIQLFLMKVMSIVKRMKIFKMQNNWFKKKKIFNKNLNAMEL